MSFSADYRTPVTASHIKLVILSAISLIMVSILCHAAFAGDETHTFLADDYPPYYYWENDTLKGFYAESILEAFKRMGVKAKYVRASWKRNLSEIEEGRVAGSIGAFPTAKRKSYAIFPPVRVFLAETWAVTRLGSNICINSLEDLRNHTIGVVAGYTYGKDFDAMAGLNKSTHTYESDLVELLINDRIDVMVGEKRVLEHAAKANDGFDKLDFCIRISVDPITPMFSKSHPGAQELSDGMARALTEMQQDGTMEKIKARHDQ